MSIPLKLHNTENKMCNFITENLQTMPNVDRWQLDIFTFCLFVPLFRVRPGKAGSHPQQRAFENNWGRCPLCWPISSVKAPKGKTFNNQTKMNSSNNNIAHYSAAMPSTNVANWIHQRLFSTLAFVQTTQTYPPYLPASRKTGKPNYLIHQQ